MVHRAPAASCRNRISRRGRKRYVKCWPGNGRTCRSMMGLPAVLHSKKQRTRCRARGKTSNEATTTGRWTTRQGQSRRFVRDCARSRKPGAAAPRAKPWAITGGQQNGGDFRARDPLGRQTGADGSAVSGGRALPDDEYYDRSREVLEEIRRRSNDRTRPESELEYLRRLLNRY